MVSVISDAPFAEFNQSVNQSINQYSELHFVA